MKQKWNILLTEELAGTLEVEADTKEEALEVARKMIDANEVPDGIIDETGGYKIQDAVEAKES